MPEITVNGHSLTHKERAVYFPLVLRAVREDSRTCESDVKRILNNAGLDLNDDRISMMLEHARVRNGFAMATRVQ